MKRYLKYIIPAAVAVLIVAAAVLFVIFSGKDDAKEPEETEPVTSPDVPAEETSPFYDYFLMEKGVKSLSFDNVSQYEGEIVDMDLTVGLLAVKSRDLDNFNQVVDKISVYDLKSGEVIFSDSVTYALDAKKWTELSLQLDYPVIKSVKRNLEDTTVTDVKVAYYLAKKGGEKITETDRESHQRTDFGNGLSAFRLGERVVWIDRDLSIIRSVNDIAANGYDVNVFNSEYQGYLYAWNSESVQIFNRLGLCSGSYTIAHDGYIRAHVLNNGSLLIQDFEKVSASDTYDVILDNVRYRVKSLLMNLVDGSTRQVELDFIVDTLETAYAQKHGTARSVLPFRLASGKDNQALIYRYANGSLSLYQEYVVLDDGLQVEYTVENRTLGLDFETAQVVGRGLYRASVSEGGGSRSYLFDLDGNVISPMSDSTLLSDSFIVSASGIYNHKMEKLLDLQKGEQGVSLLGVDTANDRVYLFKHNQQTHGDEVYVFTAEKQSLTLLSDGVDVEIVRAGNGYYVLKDTATEQYRFCDLTGEVRLVLGEWDPLRIYTMDEGLLIESDFEGRCVTFVVW